LNRKQDRLKTNIHKKKMLFEKLSPLTESL
jgi:hypothetical protein